MPTMLQSDSATHFCTAVLWCFWFGDRKSTQPIKHIIIIILIMPELYSFCSSAYNQPSVLFFGQYTVQSQEGSQQGDPIGPLLFCNTIHPLLSFFHSNLNIGYLDNVTLGGHLDVVASDVAEIMRIGAEMGLSLNISK